MRSTRPTAAQEALARVASVEPQEIGYAWSAALGLLQGLTEFLPVSSSGHLALAGHLAGRANGQPPQSVAFDLLLHLATVLVVVQAFWHRFLALWRQQRMVIGYLVAGSLPAVVVGLLFRHEFKALRLEPRLVCAALLVTAVALFLADQVAVDRRALVRLGWAGSLLVGLCQALAIVPGISRSGATISGGLLCGLEREDAVTFSFLLMVPVLLGAPLVEAFDHPEAFARLPLGPSLVGFATALVSGAIALAVLVRAVRSRKLVYFAGYCAVAGIGGFILVSIYA